MIRPFEGVLPRLAAGVYVDEAARVIGDVEIGADSSVWPFAVIRGDVNRIRIGARVSVQDNCTLHVTHDGPYTPGGEALFVGDEVTVGHGVTLHACRIGQRCLIGMGSIVLDCAVLDDEVFLAAGSVVPPGKHLAGGHLYRGTPAQAVRPLSESERAMLKYSAEHYVRLKNRYLKAGPGPQSA